MRLLVRGDLVIGRSIPVAGWLLLLCSAVHAGGGPENVALVVNEGSWASLTVANEYIQLRQIPACNVIYLPGTGLGRATVSVDVFRDKILIPVTTEITRRGLASQIDYIVYSADFPFAVDVRPDLDGDSEAASLPRSITKKASINGLTYLYQAVLAKDWKSYLSLRSNAYARAEGQGFRARYGWSTSGAPVAPSEGQRYLLSTMLAVMSGRGNSVSEVSRYLTRSAEADSTRPKGTIYLMENDNVRSETRDWAFRRTVRSLAKLGVPARIERGTIPIEHDNVLGAVVGTARFDWERSESVILPGAICEHLTSLGGDLRASARQTPLSEFLRHGAAGSSGTVTEPYAIQAKFPTSMIHVSYASGCSLAESFYQSVAGPYQLLIVGDPLCQPWAERPQVSVEGIQPGQMLSGKGIVSVSAKAKTGIRHVELFLDGKRLGEYPANFSLPVDTRSLWDGPHEFRAVAIADDPVETQGRMIIPFEVVNRPSSLTGGSQSAAIAPESEVDYADEVQIQYAVAGADSIAIMSGTRMIGQLPAAVGVANVPTEKLGVGNFALRVVGYRDGREIAESRVAVNVHTPALDRLKTAPAKQHLQRGLLLETAEEAYVMNDLGELPEKVRRNTPYTLLTLVHVKTPGMYQVQLSPTASVTSVRVNQHAVPLKKDADTASYPLQLQAGWYGLRVTGKTTDTGLPEIRFGNANVLPLSAEGCWCIK